MDEKLLGDKGRRGQPPRRPRPKTIGSGRWGQTIKSQKTEDARGAALPGSEEMDMTEAGGGKLSGG